MLIIFLFVMMVEENWKDFCSLKLFTPVAMFVATLYYTVYEGNYVLILSYGDNAMPTEVRIHMLQAMI